jgi:hypothetical protein
MPLGFESEAQIYYSSGEIQIAVTYSEPFGNFFSAITLPVSAFHTNIIGC